MQAITLSTENGSYSLPGEGSNWTARKLKLNYGASYIYNTGGIKWIYFLSKILFPLIFHKEEQGIVTDSVDREISVVLHIIQEIICSMVMRVGLFMPVLAKILWG